MIICWFGICNPSFGRNKIYIQALKKAGHIVVECQNNSRGMIKYWHLWQKHWAIRNNYDVMVVGYPGHIVVPLAKLISKKKVIADALGSLYDAEINSHQPNFLRKIKNWLTDWLMVKFADKILLESGAQKKFFEKKFGPSDKYEVVYTGAEQIFNDTKIQLEENKKFTVLFRGKLTPESGIVHILKAAEILKENKNIGFRIIGSGYFLEGVDNLISEKKLVNVELISRFLPIEELIEEMRKVDLMLGQFGNNPRLDRTIPHKAFEAFAMGIPYLTGEALAIREIAEDGVNAFFVPLADPEALSHKIEFLTKQAELLERVAMQARKIFEEKFGTAVLVEKLLKIML